MRSDKAPTMADVARKTGVSPMTVSRAFKSGSLISKDTRDAILQAAEELGYVFDSTASNLRSQKTDFIAVTIPSINNANFADTVRGLNDAVSEHGLCLLLGDTDYHLEQEALLVRTLLRHRPVGVMLTGSAHLDETRKLLRQAQVPVVETWDIPTDPIEQSVGFCNVSAAAALYEHLHQQGYRRIGYIGGASVLDHRGQQRQQGYLQAVAALGAGEPRVMEYGESPITMSHGGESVKRLLEKWPDTEAVMCVSDLSAFGAIMECHRQGRRVPEDIAIAGFGDFEVSRYCTPTITTVAVDPYGIGWRAGQLLVASAAAQRLGLPRPRERDVVEFKILAREST